MNKFKVWDLPVRLFHWSLVVLISLCLYTGYNFYDYYAYNLLGIELSLSAMAVHQYAGIGIFILIVFRILWGVFGSSHAVFWDFLRGPKAILDYMKTGISPTEGHNPMGGWMVLAFFVVILLQVSSGLFLEDNTYMFKNAPLSGLIKNETRSTLAMIHHYGHYVIFGLVGLHLLAILFYTVIKRAALVGAMITGKRRYDRAHMETPEALTHDHPWIALVLFVIVAAASIYFFFFHQF